MNINWFPGHMKKTLEDMEKKLKLVDFCVEIIDARIPYSSQNPLFKEIFKNKKRLIVFNKIDLSDESKNREWIEFLKDESTFIVPYNGKKPNPSQIVRAAFDLMEEDIKRKKERGIQSGPLRAMIVGIPNSGKSTFINGISGRKSTKTGNRPGITKTNQWIKIHPKLHLLDTPGVLWPKFENNKIGRHLAFTGAIKDEIMDRETLALRLIEELMVLQPKALEQRYHVEINDRSPIQVMDEIARSRGAIRKGAEVDYEKVSAIILDEFRKGVLGRITLEAPYDFY
ncbi:MAG: ribosome biogenesis GTPase YlqF [Tissierellia bacterium]|nr:ribosome biogenesis GTPase YlqF [Tissierellia bacterium]